MDRDEMKKLAEWAVKSALEKGAETAAVTCVETRELEVRARKGAAENLMDSASSSISVTVSIDSRKATVTSSGLVRESIEQIISDGIEIARLMERDDYFSLPDREELGVADSPLGIFSPETASFSADRMIRTAIELEKTACDMDKRIISDGARVINSVDSLVFSNSLGFCEGYRRTIAYIGISCAAEEESRRGQNIGKKQSSFWYSQSTSQQGLAPTEEVARKAVERTIRKLGSVRPKTCEAPVVFDPFTARKFLTNLAKAVDGGNIYKKSSFLVDKKGEMIGSPLLTIHDDPLLEGRLGSRPFDAEGVRSRTNTVFKEGRLETYLMSSYHARKLKEKTTGNAGGRSNFFLEPGAARPADLIGSIDEGLYITYLIGPGINIATGDFSQGAHGIWIEKGELTRPIDECTVAGTFQKMLRGITAVASDIDFNSSVATPSIKIENLTISGT